jgi:hypothetical protein
MMRVQFVKAPPASVIRGEWLLVEVRIVNESNGSIKNTGKVNLVFAICNGHFYPQVLVADFHKHIAYWSDRLLPRRQQHSGCNNGVTFSFLRRRAIFFLLLIMSFSSISRRL